jgi:hypothetical protein
LIAILASHHRDIVALANRTTPRRARGLKLDAATIDLEAQHGFLLNGLRLRFTGDAAQCFYAHHVLLLGWRGPLATRRHALPIMRRD